MTPTDEIEIIKWTVLLEAAGEPFPGKLAVANVIVNRMKERGKNAFEICWQPYQFSCWLDPLKTVATKLTREPVSIVEECGKAAIYAYNKQVADPSFGATHYLNEPLTRKIRGDGILPMWVSRMTKTVVIGQHTFYK